MILLLFCLAWGAAIGAALIAVVALCENAGRLRRLLNRK